MVCGIQLSPKFLLALFFVVNLLNYADRGIVSGVLDDLHDAFGIDKTAQGVLGSAFMGGYMALSPVFAALVPSFPPFKLMSCGLLIWCASAVLAGLASSYRVLVIARVLSGIGEASFQCIAPPFIDDMAPPAAKGTWLAVFYAAIPVGQALGFVYGGIMASAISWRAAFLLEAVIMGPFMLLCFFVSNTLDNKQDKNQTSIDAHNLETDRDGEINLFSQTDSHAEDGGNFDESEQATPLLGASDLQDKAPVYQRKEGKMHNSSGSGENDIGLSHENASHDYETGMPAWKRVLFDLKDLLMNPVWLFCTLGYAAFTWVLGAFAFWGPAYVNHQFGTGEKRADELFGGITVVTGFTGTAIGGALLDFMMRRRLAEHDMRAKTTIAFGVQTAAIIISCPILLASFLFADESQLWEFMGMLLVGELVLLATTSPSNAIFLWAVDPHLRPLSMAMSVVFAHLLGDVPSPVVAGWIWHNWNARLSMFVTCLMLVVASVLWLIGTTLAYRAQDPKRKRSDVSQGL